jgi:hypothetical protein
MWGSRFLPLWLAAGAAAAATPWPASAQCRLCSTPTTARDDSVNGGDVRLEIESNLNFDRLIVAGAGQGTAVIRPDGTSEAQGAISQLGPRTMVGTVSVHGEANRAVRVDLPQRIQLYSLGGGTITVDDLTSDLPSLPRLDSAGSLTFRFGGRVRITGDADGEYRGDLRITVEYQ